MTTEIEANIEQWTLPDKFSEMSPIEKAKTIRSSILRFLNNVGPATKTVIKKEIQAKNDEAVKRALDYLVNTRHIYSETYGSRDTIYFPNGRLAHPLLQGNVKCGRVDYAIRTYIDRITGRNLTVTEYGVSPSGEKEAKGGIRIDLVDLDVLISELKRIKDLISESNIIDRGLLTR